MDTARLWMLRVDEPDFDGWDAFTEWLEADPVHLRTYEDALEVDAWARELVRDAALPANDVSEQKPPRKRSALWSRYALGGALAASLIGVLLWSNVPRGADVTEIITGPGELRTVELADGSTLVVNGNSRLTYNEGAPRLVTLDRGEALFDVHRDDTTPFVVMVGETRLVEAGTVFNVAADAGALDVSVAEGAVVYGHGAEEVRLEPGDRLLRPAPSAGVEILRADPGEVGGWRKGVLQYDNADLSSVARDLSRALSKPVRALAGAERMRYTGTLAVNGPDHEVMARAGALLGVRVTETEEMWEMRPGDASPP